MPRPERRRRRLNKAAFAVPTGAVQGNLGRNVLNGFRATEIHLTVRRRFELHERLSLQARADLFNLFNHPNFCPPVNYMTSPLFRRGHPDARRLDRPSGDSKLQCRSCDHD